MMDKLKKQWLVVNTTSLVEGKVLLYVLIMWVVLYLISYVFFELIECILSDSSFSSVDIEVYY